MKLAFIYFGQPRFINNPYCYETQKQRIMSQGDYDVFAHLWEPTDDGYDFSTWSGLSNVKSSNEDINTFVSKWQPKSLLTEENQEFANPDICQKFNEILPGGEKRFYNFNLCLSQLYSLEKGIELFEKHVKDSGAIYDFVIFMRTDLCVWDFPNLTQLEKGFFYFSSIFDFNHFADLCYITDPKYVSGLKAYSFVTDKHIDIKKYINFGNAESIKKGSFLYRFSTDNLKQIPIPVRVVRGIDDIGKQW
jgi:hypothetical protein